MFLQGKAILGVSRLVWAIAVPVVAVLLIYWAVSSWVSGSKTEAERDLNSETVKAVLDSVEEAKEHRRENDEEVEQINQETKNAIEQILEQPAGDSNDAAVDAVCSMRLYRDTERCTRLRQNSGSDGTN